MTRPRPTVTSRNDCDAFYSQAQALAKCLVQPGVVGVLLVGGAARGHADRWSELGLAYTLPWTPGEWRERVGQALLVRERGALPAAEFDRRWGLRQAIQSPTVHLLRREERGGEAWLAFDEARLLDWAAHDFSGLLGWNRRLLSALVGQRGEA